MSAAAEHPQVIKNAFLTQKRNDAGIYAVRFFIRGKPWVVSVDDQMLFIFPNYTEPKLVFTRPDKKDHSLWAPILEKAWAKVMGNYNRAEGGLISQGIEALTGAPSYSI
jgi:hypothetical protein